MIGVRYLISLNLAILIHPLFIPFLFKISRMISLINFQDFLIPSEFLDQVFTSLHQLIIEISISL